MENTITIRLIEGRTSKAGKPYWQVEDMQGNKYSLFEQEIYSKLKPGLTYNLDIVTSHDGRFKNIRGIVGEAVQPIKVSGANLNVDSWPKPEKKAGSWRSPKEIIACELTGFAKDLAIADIKLSPPECGDAVLAAYKKILCEL